MGWQRTPAAAVAARCFSKLPRERAEGEFAAFFGREEAGEAALGAGQLIDGDERGPKIQGSTMRSNHFRVHMPQYIDLYQQGRLKLDEMVSRTGRLEDVNEAFPAMKAGEVSRTVLKFD